MKSVIFLFAFAIQAFAYNPFPINAWIQRGNGEMIEVPELVGKPSPDKLYRVWYTNLVFDVVYYTLVRWDELEFGGEYTSRSNAFWDDAEAEDFANELRNYDSCTNVVLEYHEMPIYDGHDYMDDITIIFEMDGEPDNRDYDVSVYFGIFSGHENPKNLFDDNIYGMDFQSVPYTKDEYFYNTETQQWEYNGSPLNINIPLFKIGYKTENNGYSETVYSATQNAIITTNSTIWNEEYISVPGMYPRDKGDESYYFPTLNGEFGNSMGGINLTVKGKFVFINFFPSVSFRIRCPIIGYIDIAGISRLGDPSQELKIEKIDFDFSKSDGTYVIEDWDNYKPFSTSERNWNISCFRMSVCSNCTYPPRTYTVKPIHNTNGTYNINKDIRCGVCGAKLPLEDYGYSRFSEQINIRFMISVPQEWNCGDHNAEEYNQDIGALVVWITDELGNDYIPLFFGKDAGDSLDDINFSWILARQQNRERKYVGDSNNSDSISTPYIKDITPENYNPLRRVFVIQGTYFIEEHSIGQELKHSFYRITYNP